MRTRWTTVRPANRRALLGIFGAAAAVYFAWGVVGISGLSGPARVAVGLVTATLGTAALALETWAIHLAANALSGRRIDAWRSAVLAVIVTALEILEHVVVPRPRPWGTVAAIWVAECFVLAILAQYLLPTTFGRAIGVSILSRVFAFLMHLALLLVVFGPILAWFYASFETVTWTWN